MKAFAIGVAAVLVPVALSVGLYRLVKGGWDQPLWPSSGKYVTEHTDYHSPPTPADDPLADDTLEDKQPAFDAARVDRRPLGAKGEWLINNSAAVFRLDVPIIKPDVEPHFLTLHPSFKAAIDAHNAELLPSANLIDGQATAFDPDLHAT